MVNKTGIIYLQKDKFQIFSPSLGSILEFRFVPEIVRDLDIINSTLLENLIKVFVTNGKIVPSNLVFVLADTTYFTKDILQSPQEQKKPNSSNAVSVANEVLQKQADEFIEHVPFDNVVSKTLPLKNGIKVCATNKDFYEAFVIAFEHLGFTTESVIPGLVLGNGLSTRPVLDQGIVNLIIQRTNSYKPYDLLHQQVFQPPAKFETEDADEVEVERLQNKKPDKKRLIALSGIFASLLLVLVVVYVQSQAPVSPPQQPAQASNPPPTILPPIQVAASPTIAPVVSPNDLQTQALTVQIVNAASTSVAAKNLSERLSQYTFKNILLQTQSPVGSASTIVSFSPNVTQQVRNLILDEVKKIKSNITVQEKGTTSADITIVLGE